MNLTGDNYLNHCIICNGRFILPDKGHFCQFCTASKGHALAMLKQNLERITEELTRTFKKD